MGHLLWDLADYQLGEGVACLTHGLAKTQYALHSYAASISE